jgi:hypothetical protein
VVSSVGADLAFKAMEAPFFDVHSHEGAGQGRMTNEVHGTVLSRAASQLHAPFFARPFDEYLFATANPSLIASKLNGLLHLK